MPNFHNVFEKRAEPRSYRKILTPTDDQKAALADARKKIRAHLRTVVPRLTETHFGPEGRVSPKFYVQGSWAYDTCNQPCHQGQEMDLDYGVYLPVSTWEESGLRPKRAAKVYFDLMEEALRSLVKQEGWVLGEGKQTCVRIHLPEIGAHVDVPLYVAPDKDFEQLVEKVVALASFDEARAVHDAADDEEINSFQWHQLTHIMLATRDGTWMDSDPRKVSDWFDSAVERHGPQLRRVSRYLKGLRDFRWTSGGPSSILLMVCVVDGWRCFDGRDDLALLDALERVGPKLAAPVYCSAVSDEDFNRIPQAERDDVVQWANLARATLSDVIHGTQMHRLDDAFSRLQENVDHRICCAPDLVYADNTPPSIRSYPAAIAPQPQHRESRAG